MTTNQKPEAVLVCMVFESQADADTVVDRIAESGVPCVATAGVFRSIHFLPHLIYGLADQLIQAIEENDES